MQEQLHGVTQKSSASSSCVPAVVSYSLSAGDPSQDSPATTAAPYPKPEPTITQSMSIVTRTGDTGITGLMYNRRVSKCDPRVEAYGTVDELNAALGLARASAPQNLVPHRITAIQQELIALMGELATHPDDLQRYARDAYPRINESSVAHLDQWITEIETQQPARHDWAIPGQAPHAAALDLARTICRRAERRICALHDTHQLHNPHILVFLNRLSDLLWLCARQVELNSHS
jgi:cob(I)alamin adenosyltransferase